MARWTHTSTAVGSSVDVSITRPGPNNVPTTAVVYLLHGTGGAGPDWEELLPLPAVSTRYGVAFVAPSLGNAWARVDQAGRNWLRLLSHEMPGLVEESLGLLIDRDQRWVVGISAGGYSALRLALQFPDVFGRCGAFSPGGLWIDHYLDYLRSMDAEQMENAHLRDVFGPDLICTPDDVLLNLATIAATIRPRCQISITMGENDDLKPPCDAFVDRLRAIGVPCDYRVSPGGHDWSFWERSLGEFLQWATCDA